VVNVLALVVFVLFLLVGLVGVVVPVLPGVPVAAVGAVLAAWMIGFHRFGWTPLLSILGLAVLAQLIDLAGNWLGARVYGAGRAGGVLGSLAGLLFFPPFGFLIGALVGAALFELAAGRPLEEALRAGVGAFVGALGGTVVKLLIVVAMAVVGVPRLL